MRIIMLGGPGSGKSTYTEYLIKHFNITHIYPGGMLRKEIEKGTEIGQIAKDIVSKGSITIFSATLIDPTIPSRWRSSGMRPTPREIIAAGVISNRGWSSIKTSPLSTESMPEITPAKAVWPLPETPAIPRISPEKTVRSTFCKLSRRARPFTETPLNRSIAGPFACVSRVWDGVSAPTISRAICCSSA